MDDEDDSELNGEPAFKVPEIPEYLNKVKSWDYFIEDHLPPGAFVPVNIQEYFKMIQAKYDITYPYPRGAKRKIDPNEAAMDNYHIEMKRL